MAAGLGKSDAVIEGGISKLRVMIERIVNRMLNTAGFTFSAEPDIERRDAEVLQERSVIGA